MPTPETEIRLAVLEKGYTPLLNHGKRPIHDKWQVLQVDAAEVWRWDRSLHKSTGIRVENGLAVVDVDIEFPDRPDLVEQLAAEAQQILPGIFERGLVRFSSGVKEAWFVRVDGVRFGRLASRLWMRPQDSDADPDVKAPRARLEIFGGGSTRQFGAFGPHSYDDDGEAITFYKWDGPSPADVPLVELPAYDVEAFGRLCNAFDKIAKDAGLVEKARPRRYGDAETLYVLEPDTVVELQDGTRATIAELERIAPDLRGGEDYMRCSGTFHSPERTRRDSHTIAMGRHGIGIHDFMEGVTFCRRDREPPARHDIGPALRQFSEERLGAATDHEEQEAEADHDASATSPREEDGRRATHYDTIEIVDDEEQNYRNAIDWLLEEMAWDAKANKGNGIVRPIYPDGGAPIGVVSLRTVMRPYDWRETGPRGGVQRHSPVDTWLTLAEKAVVEGVRMMPAAARPLFRENGLLFLNTYAPPRHPTDGGSIAVFEAFMRRLLPDDVERTWLTNWLAYKIQHPEARMVAVLMLARATGTGRGKLFELLQRVLGERYVAATSYRKISGGEGSKFNAEFADKLIVWVNEAKSSEGNRYHNKRAEAEALKVWIEPNENLLVDIEAKGVDVRHARLAVSTIICTNNRDGVPLQDSDRRVAVLTNGQQMTVEEIEAFDTWMRDPANVGALYRHLKGWAIETDKAVFNPYMAPHTDGRALMIDTTESELDNAWWEATGHLSSAADLYTMSQIVTLTRHFARSTHGGDFDDLVRVHTKREGFRIGHKDGDNWRPMFNGMRERVYTFSEQQRRRWSNAAPAAIIAELRKAQAAADSPTARFNKLLRAVKEEG